MVSTTHTQNGEKRINAIPAHEFSGEVAALGLAVADPQEGQAVYGMNDWFADGALAEYCITRPEWVAPKPLHLSHAEAASVPIGALTAWQGLFDHAQLKRGERVLIHGGAGAVGVYAIQLARRCGAHVITTVSARNVDFVRELGANEAIDYKSHQFEDEASSVDVVFDAVGGDTLQRSWALLNANGRLVTIAAESEGTSNERAKQAFFIVRPDRAQLVELGRLLDTGELRPFVDTVLPLSKAWDAYSGKAKGKGRGKLVISLKWPD